MRTVTAARVLRAERRGSSLPVVVETGAGVFFTKLRGAAQGAAALVAETLVAGLADAVGLRVPARVLVEVGPGLPSDDRDQELRDLLEASRGVNLGFAYLEGARDLRADEAAAFDPDLASKILWLDGLVQNPDRTARNPNVLAWGGAYWLIDHGAALGFQHDWPAVTEDAPRRPYAPDGHLLAARATRVGAWDGLLAARLGREALRRIVAAVPDAFLAPLVRGDAEVARRRAAYEAYLWKRLKAPRPFP